MPARSYRKGYVTVQPNEHRADEYRLHAEQLRARADQFSVYPATRDSTFVAGAQCQELAMSIEQHSKG